MRRCTTLSWNWERNAVRAAAEHELQAGSGRSRTALPACSAATHASSLRASSRGGGEWGRCEPRRRPLLRWVPGAAGTGRPSLRAEPRATPRRPPAPRHVGLPSPPAAGPGLAAPRAGGGPQPGVADAAAEGGAATVAFGREPGEGRVPPPGPRLKAGALRSSWSLFCCCPPDGCIRTSGWRSRGAGRDAEARSAVVSVVSVVSVVVLIQEVCWRFVRFSLRPPPAWELGVRRRSGPLRPSGRLGAHSCFCGTQHGSAPVFNGNYMSWSFLYKLASDRVFRQTVVLKVAFWLLV